VAPDIWRLEGFSGHPFNIELSSPNIYIFREDETVLLTDTGYTLFTANGYWKSFVIIWGKGAGS